MDIRFSLESMDAFGVKEIVYLYHSCMPLRLRFLLLGAHGGERENHSSLAAESILSEEFDHIEAPVELTDDASINSRVELDQVPTYAEATNSQFNQEQEVL